MQISSLKKKQNKYKFLNTKTENSRISRTQSKFKIDFKIKTKATKKICNGKDKSNITTEKTQSLQNIFKAKEVNEE